jgi:hypothetical protein
MFLESHNSEEFIRRKKIELDLPEQLWEKTDGLPLRIKALLKDEPVTREMLTEFIDQVKEKMKIQVREHFGWVSFANAIKLDLAEITRI